MFNNLKRFNTCKPMKLNVCNFWRVVIPSIFCFVFVLIFSTPINEMDHSSLILFEKKSVS
jgi:hypothetical protein